MGCTSELQYCNPKITDPGKQCKSFYWSVPFIERLAQLWPDKDDLAAFDGYLLSNSLLVATPDSFYGTVGLPSLLARFTLDTNIQYGVQSRDSWRREMEFICQASLPSFQSNVPLASQNGVAGRNRTICDLGSKGGLCEKLCRNQVSLLTASAV